MFTLWREYGVSYTISIVIQTSILLISGVYTKQLSCYVNVLLLSKPALTLHGKSRSMNQKKTVCQCSQIACWPPRTIRQLRLCVLSGTY